ncbi:helix-turn-helix domain-containing protein [Endozoicomonas sp. OPT23]|uniref:helix-turn-helix domain-containing protein n=1 Tax=Endozoicomonas sp. OPT23 TaxID=2072845 RepID=UPI001891B768|nr:helix-turn-helix transcriptional regulator [Endozoicomonas sp. OPT23]
MRKHLGVSHSQLAELLGDTSELEIINLEKGKVEASLKLLEKVNHATGASIDWLKHGSMKDHICGHLHSHWFPVLFFTRLYKVVPEPEFVPFPQKDYCYFETEHTQKLISYIKELPALQLTVCADPQEWSQIYLLVDRSEYRTDIWDLNALDFWHPGWLGEHHYIPAILDFFQKLSELHPAPPVKGCFLSRSELLKLKSGLVSPCNKKMARQLALGKMSQPPYKNVISWPMDLIDIHHEEGGAKYYQSWYGERFVEIQKHSKEYVLPRSRL